MSVFNTRRFYTATNSNTISPPRPYPKRPLLARLFNVLHYSTVALLVGSTVFLAVNVVGAAQAKKKSFRAEREAAIANHAKESKELEEAEKQKQEQGN